MSVYTSLALFLALFFSSSFFDSLKQARREKVLLCLAIACILIIGLRNPVYWIDTWAYVQSFKITNTLDNFSFNDTISAYSEKGYYLLCVIIRTFTNSTFWYLTIIGILSMTFLFKSLRQYACFPILGLCIYIARYLFARDMNQMRAGLAISIIMSFCYLLESKKLKTDLKYVLVCYLTSFIHTSMLTAIPIVILDRLHIGNKTIFLGILMAFLVSSVFSQQIIDFISQSDLIQEMAKDYVDKEGDSAKAYASDLTNPMIYYQCLILFVYTFMEKKLAPLSKLYYVFRNGFFMSTVVLIVLCQYAILAGRVSTIFATFEIFMIPLIFKGLSKPSRRIAYLILLAPLVIFFMYNIK